MEYLSLIRNKRRSAFNFFELLFVTLAIKWTQYEVAGTHDVNEAFVWDALKKVESQQSTMSIS